MKPDVTIVNLDELPIDGDKAILAMLFFLAIHRDGDQLLKMVEEFIKADTDIFNKDALEGIKEIIETIQSGETKG